MSPKKFHLKCRQCNTVVDNFLDWFDADQNCPNCHSKQVHVIYEQGYAALKPLLSQQKSPSSLWYYFDYLPLLSPDNIISFKEGIVPIDRWKFMEDYALKRYNIDCKIYAQRNDCNFSTGTFKDLAGTVVASGLKENNQSRYVVASTGNIATAYSKYLGRAGITLYAFIPHNSSKMMEAQISAYGQKVFRVDGDYAKAKAMAAEFAEEHNIPLAAGNFDPLRVEAKKTMVYEWLRLLDDFPTVYIQALSGGTGPLGIEKAFIELRPHNLVDQIPRQILIQSDQCAPMAMAWKKAKKQNFPSGWQTDYPIIKNPDTIIPTLSTGNPKTYPVISQFVKDTGGEIIASKESEAIHVARLTALETGVLMGPAAALPVLGLFQALHAGFIKNGDVIAINIGEGVNRSPDFLKQFVDDSLKVNSLKDCSTFNKGRRRAKYWDRVKKLFA